MSSSKTNDLQTLDRLTGGAFTAATSGERSARVREWLLSQPSLEQMNEVFHELSARDKGAAKALRERIEELRRARQQDAVAAEWSARALELLGIARLNIADALAWQRDAAKAGAPLSREPLAGLKTRLAERVRLIEDLQHQVMVQRETAVLLTQRIEVLSTKTLTEAQAAHEALSVDVQQWQSQAQTLQAEPAWPSVDLKFPPLLESVGVQLKAVWEAFAEALAVAHRAWDDPQAPMPPVPVWREDIARQRGAAQPEPAPAAPPRTPKVDPSQRQALRQQATQAVLEVLQAVEKEVSEGHGKATAGAAASLRQVLKLHGRHLDTALDARVHAALTAAGELEGWQRWRADQIRQELVAKAEALMKPVDPAPAGSATEAAGVAAATGPVASEPQALSGPVAEGASADDPSGGVSQEPSEGLVPSPAAASAPREVRKVPALSGRKMQEALRQLREAWKQTDQGGLPNHGLWRRFDAACNEAYSAVQLWLDQTRQSAAAQRTQRTGLIEEVRQWTAAHAQDTDWRGQIRALHQFGERWRSAGHMSEKAYAEMQAQWKKVIQQAGERLHAAQQGSMERRQALIAQAREMAAQPALRIDAVKALQQQWQQEAQAVPLERKTEQKLWDTFRAPIDEAFQRKGQARQQQAASLSARDRAVLEASRALDDANAEGDVSKIRQAMAALDAALKGPTAAAASAPAAPASVKAGAGAAPAAAGQAQTPDVSTDGSADSAADPAGHGAAEAPVAPEEAALPPVKPAPRAVVAVRGDDRPGARGAAPAVPAGRRDARLGAPARNGERGSRPDRFQDRPARHEDREERGPRLADAAFRAQREARERAELALRKLAAQAHGETLTQLLAAWQNRQPEQVPPAQALGRAVNAATRQAWVQALGAQPGPEALTALLRLEMAAEAPTPAEHMPARRALQLQLLTRRNEPGPRETWGQDVAAALAGAHSDGAARRLTGALRHLLRG